MTDWVDHLRWYSRTSRSQNGTTISSHEATTVISDYVYRAGDRYERYLNVMSDARRGMPRSRHLQQHASNVLQLARRAQVEPCTRFMPDIARSVFQLMDELVLYSECEAMNVIFRMGRDMGKEANVLEGKMDALRALLEAELEWKRNKA